MLTIPSKVRFFASGYYKYIVLCSINVINNMRKATSLETLFYISIHTKYVSTYRVFGSNVKKYNFIINSKKFLETKCIQYTFTVLMQLYSVTLMANSFRKLIANMQICVK